MTARGTAFDAFTHARGAARSLDARLLDSLASTAASRLAPIGLATVARDVAALSGLTGDERRALSVIVLAAALVAREGSTRLPLPGSAFDELAASALAPLGADGAGLATALLDPGALVARATGVVGPASSDRPLLWADGALSPARLFRAEQAIARALIALSPRQLDASTAIADVLARPTRGPDGAPTALTDEQVDAVAAACELGLTVITGGPGTGKTSVLVALLRALVRAGIPASAIALAAPTGKAALRMTESTARALASLDAPTAADSELSATLPRASTLHRLLGYSPTRRAFTRGPDDRLPHELVIIDEASMVDVELGRALALALPTNARLVLLGDPDQLPSVGAGALLADLASARPDAVRTLTVSHRMRSSDPDGAAVLALSRQIASGAVEPSSIVRRSSARELTWRGVERVDEDALEELLDQLGARHTRDVARPLDRPLSLVEGALDEADTARVKGALAESSKLRVLSPLHGGALGTEALSRGVAAAVASRLGRGAATLAPGTPILVTENDYVRGLFNGDQGLLVRVNRRGAASLEVAFAEGAGVVLHRWDALSERAKPTFALTVHKSQGSECEIVVLALGDAPGSLASRPLLYTAVTRAKRGVVLIGAEDAVARLAATTHPRSSGLRALLADERR